MVNKNSYILKIGLAAIVAVCTLMAMIPRPNAFASSCFICVAQGGPGAPGAPGGDGATGTGGQSGPGGSCLFSLSRDGESHCGGSTGTGGDGTGGSGGNGGDGGRGGDAIINLGN